FCEYHHPLPWNSLVPDFVVAMNCPAVECPNSARNWFVSSVKSSTDSWMTGASAPVTLGLLLSTPSTTKLLLRGRFPPTEPPIPVTPPDWVATPGAKIASWIGFPVPNGSLKGIWVIALLSKLTPSSCDDDVLTSCSAPAVTVTVSATLPSSTTSF